MTIRDRARNLMRARDGELTETLRREQAAFGLGQVPATTAPDRVVTSVCGFCSTGCSLDVHIKDGVAVNLTPTASYPVNRGTACPKGWEALTPLAAADRGTVPLLRGRNGRLEPVTWERAAQVFAERLKHVQAEHGADSVAFLSTGQIPTEEMALLGIAAKFGMGMVHGDGNTRQCMATSVVAYKEAFGFDAPPYTYADFEQSDVIVLVGSNLCVAHPIMWERVCRNPNSPEIVVIDPRRTETAMAATQHYPIAPKSDLHFLYGLANVLVARGWVDRDFLSSHTSGFEEFAAHVAPYTPEVVALETGLRPDDVEKLAATIHAGQRVSFWWTMGVNQSHEGVRTAQAIINLALMTGNIGRPGTGANSITGQCNAMGSRLFANTTNLLGGHDFANPDHREKVAGILGVDESRIPRSASLAYDQILEGVVAGRIRGLWVIATNTAHSWINQSYAHDVLERLDFLVVQDMYPTSETAQHADLYLPAAGWGEKTGTFINSERRVGVIRKVAEPPGAARTDFEIFRILARAWGCEDTIRECQTPEATFDVLKLLSAGQPCDISGLGDYDSIAEAGGVQWPYPVDATAGDRERRLFEGGSFYTADRRARFVYEEPRPPAETTSERYPLVLLTGRGSSAEWHTGTRTSKSSILRSLSAQRLYVQLSPVDAELRSIEPNDQVTVVSLRGEVHALAHVSANVAPGQVFLPMHHPDTNQLTAPSFDPYSRQPSYKWAAVEVRRM